MTSFFDRLDRLFTALLMLGEYVFRRQVYKKIVDESSSYGDGSLGALLCFVMNSPEEASASWWETWQARWRLHRQLLRRAPVRLPTGGTLFFFPGVD